jgi:hypothetical protein
MAEIARRAEESSKALAALQQAVKDLPKPKFNLGRSIELLRDLASWANPKRGNEGFPGAGTVSAALKSGLATGCEGRKPVTARSTKVVPPPSAPDLVTEWATKLGSLGGSRRTEAQSLAARKCMEDINLRKRAAKTGQRAKRGA